MDIAVAVEKMDVNSFDKFCGGEPLWNDSLMDRNSWPQFTDCFQQTILVWVPLIWLVMTTPIYAYYLYTFKVFQAVPVNPLNTSKSGYNGCAVGKATQNTNLKERKFKFLGLSLSLLSLFELLYAISGKKDGNTADSQIVAKGIQVMCFIYATVILHIERIKGMLTSGVLFIFWLMILLSSIIPFYSKIILKEYNSNLFEFSTFYVYFTLVFVQMILFCFADKRKEPQNINKRYSPEERASFLSKIVFHWINPLMFIGYKRALKEADLFELHYRDQSVNFVPYFYDMWIEELSRATAYNKQKEDRSEVEKSQHSERDSYAVINPVNETTPLLPEYNKKKPPSKPLKTSTKEASLFKVLAKAYGIDLLKAHFCKFVYDLLQFVSPLLLNILIGYTKNRESEPEWKGYVYACSFFVVAVIQSCFFHQNFHIGMTLGMRIKSSLISAIYRKALTVNNEAKKSSSVGEVVNLMSVDAQRIQDITGYLWMMWSAPLQIILAMYLLWGTLGPSVLAGLGVMVLLMPVNGFIAAKQRKYQMSQMKLKDQRIKLMNEVLNGIKVLKLYAWELSFQAKVLDIRNEELNILRKSAWLNAFGTFTWTCAPFLVTLATFATYILSSDQNYLDAQKAFVSLSLFNILRFPMNLLPMLLSFIVQANVSVGRIGKYLRHHDLDPNSVTFLKQYSDVIYIDKGAFTWDKSLTSPTLKNINLKIPKGKLVAIVGQVGSGKSSLISALLGEMVKVCGTVNLKGSVAYVPQEAWIQNASVLDNVLFGNGLEYTRYNNTIDACALRPDLDILPGGEKTEIGEKGINLSGGQKQRVSLARAVYNEADVYLMDDPLSAVDSHVGKHIFEKVMGANGLLKDKTRILVTHGVHWLPRMDTIVVMTNGEISELGSYDELLSHNGSFAQFLKTYLTEETGSNVYNEDDPEIQEIKSKILERVDSVTSDGGTSADDHKSRRKVKEKTKVEDGHPEVIIKDLKKDEEKLIEEEKSETGKVKLSVYIGYAKAIGLVQAVFIFVIYGLYQALNVYSSVWLEQWTDDHLLSNRSLANTSTYQEKNEMYLGVYGALGVGQAIAVLIYALLASVRFVKAAGNIHYKMITNILRSPMSFFDTTPVGRIVNRFSRDVETVDNNLPQLFRSWINTVFNVASTIIVISYSTPYFLIVIIPLAFLYWLVQRFYIPTSRQLKRIESTTRSPIYSHFGETITGASSIRAYGVSERFIEESQLKVDKNLVFYFAGIASNRWLGFRLEFLGSLIVLAAALFAVLSADDGIVGLSVSYALQVTGSLNWMVRMTSDLETNIVSVERMKEYSETASEAAWKLLSKRPPSNWPADGKVTFENYMTRYREGLDLVLKGINCEILPGEKVGIVGRTGAGKSSLTLALFRLIEASNGSINIDGHNIGELGLHDLRSKLTILPQDPVIFSGTLRMNLDPFDKHNDDEVWKALDHAHLKSFVKGLSCELEYECGEGGQNLSVGQRQLVCLARTLLRKTKILVLDEATAAVDMETDDLIQQTIKREFKDSTVLSIAHRLNTVMDYDKIMVLDSGTIKEYDSPNRLLEDNTTIFYGLAKDAGLVH